MFALETLDILHSKVSMGKRGVIDREGQGHSTVSGKGDVPSTNAEQKSITNFYICALYNLQSSLNAELYLFSHTVMCQPLHNLLNIECSASSCWQPAGSRVDVAHESD